MANLLTRHRVIVLVAVISPYVATQEEVRSAIGRFLEVYVNTPLSVCEERDPKGLYRKARTGEMRCLTGIDDPYEPPYDPRSNAAQILKLLAKVHQWFSMRYLPPWVPTLLHFPLASPC